jgi:LPXTG-motif cell wall-anchored protein
LRRIMVILMIAAVMVAIGATTGPAMAQVEDKAAARAAKKADKQAARQAAKQEKRAQNPGAQKQLPATGGIAASSVVVLGTGALLVGGGLMVRRVIRH